MNGSHLHPLGSSSRSGSDGCSATRGRKRRCAWRSSFGRALTIGTAHGAGDEDWTHVLEVSSSDDSLQICSAAGFAAVQALTVVLQDDQFDPARIDDALTDRDVDADDLDAAFFAAAAWSDGPVWVAGSSAERRMEFWTWWLGEAVAVSRER